MKNKFVVILLVVVVATLFGLVGTVFAQSSTPNTPYSGNQGFGRGGMMGQGLRVNQTAQGTGVLHDYMIPALAKELGLTVDDLNARLADGDRVSDIASEKGLTVDEFRTLMTDARSAAIDAAVADGVLTQDQADWMKTRGAGMMGFGQAQGRGRGMMGQGQFGAGNPACPYYQTNP